MKSNDDFYRDLKARVANLAIGPSALRNMVGEGGVKAARDYCVNVELFHLGNEKKFRDVLDKLTNELRNALPPRKRGGGERWGPARKVLNIYLADVCYNHYIREKYMLARIESLLELPLDSFVQNGIIHQMKDLGLPFKHKKAVRVVNVNSEINEVYQQAASQIASHLGKPRIFLDLEYWRRKKQE